MFKLRKPVERSELRKECEWVRTKMTLWLRSEKDAKQTCLAACKGLGYFLKLYFQDKFIDVKYQKLVINKKLRNIPQCCFAIKKSKTNRWYPWNFLMIFLIHLKHDFRYCWEFAKKMQSTNLGQHSTLWLYRF